ncbi:MAG: hypothetical protein JHD02_11785 [Thermoleophilaceae bacterium]|nr:hypothetical protein [Thermoleophilaceae bacterium]
MNLLYIFLVAFVIKLPVLWCGWYIYKAIHDVPLPELDGRDGDFVRADFEPGPRQRGPHGGPPAVSIRQRRGDKGHDESTPAPRVTTSSKPR